MTKPNTKNKLDAGKVLIEELTNPASEKAGGRRSFQIIIIPLLAVFSGLVVGALIIVLTSEAVYAGFQQSIGSGLATAWNSVSTAYYGLFRGAFGTPARFAEAFQTMDPSAILQAFIPFLESLTVSIPYILAGLGVALGFRAGVFNIGAEGQVFIGALAGTYVGYSVTGLPAFIHLPLTLLAGFAGGALWGFIPGWLKAKTGGHEVINTIMMNYIAFKLSDWLLNNPMQREGSTIPVSPNIELSAYLPTIFPYPSRFHLGFFVALAVAFVVWFVLFKTTWGFNLRTAGANPNGAKYAGMNVTKYLVLAMALSGGLCGLAGVNDVVGINHNLAVAFSSGYGFDSIALALLGSNHPVGVVLSAILFGFLRNGAIQMQLDSGIPIDIVSIVQALILMFIATPAIIRTIFRLRTPTEGDNVITVRSWGGQ